MNRNHDKMTYECNNYINEKHKQCSIVFKNTIFQQMLTGKNYFYNQEKIIPNR